MLLCSCCGTACGLDVPIALRSRRKSKRAADSAEPAVRVAKDVEEVVLLAIPSVASRKPFFFRRKAGLKITKKNFLEPILFFVLLPVSALHTNTMSSGVSVISAPNGEG